MSNWVVRSKKTQQVLKIGAPFFLEEEARSYIERMGQPIASLYEPYYVGPGGKSIRRMVNEGLIPHDLDNILLSKVSIDEYLPADPRTDNIVVAFFLKGVPEAVLPFKNFVDKFSGVLDVDFGDSDTIPNTSIVYVEFDRDNYDVGKIDALIRETTKLTNFGPEDYTITFPHTGNNFPYDPRLLKRYFASRDRRENYLAQKKAQKQADRERQRELTKRQAAQAEAPSQERTQTQQAAAEEEMAVALGNLLFEDDLA